MQDSYETVSKPPNEATEAEMSDFLALVRTGGEVVDAGLEDRVRRAARLAFIYDAEILLGAAALKRASQAYCTRVWSAAGIPVPNDAIHFELGWVVVRSVARGRGLSLRLCQAAIGGATSGEIFATSRVSNTRMHGTLRKVGFEAIGRPFKSQLGTHQLQLFISVPANCRTATDSPPG